MSRGGGRGGGWRGKPMAAGGIDVPEGLIVSYHEIPLYPPHPGTQPFPAPSPEDEGLMEAYWSLKKSMEESAFYLFKAYKKPDIERYSDRFRAQKKRIPISSVPTSLEFFPSELHAIKEGSKKSSGKKTNVKLDLSSKDYLDSLQKLEEKDGDATDAETKAVDGEGDEEEQEPEFDEDMDEEEGDYQLDYYNEDMDLVGGDSDGGGNEDY